MTASPAVLTVTVLVFARYAELLGASTLQLALTAPATVGDLIAHLRTLPGGEQLPARPICARNLVQAAWDEPIAPGDELALLPPMAGG